jgi:hypothetical protein
LKYIPEAGSKLHNAKQGKKTTGKVSVVCGSQIKIQTTRGDSVEE